MKITTSDHRNEISTAKAGVIYVHKRRCVKEITWGAGFQYVDFATAKFILDSFLSVREDADSLRVTIIDREGTRLQKAAEDIIGKRVHTPTRENRRVYFDKGWFVNIDGQPIAVRMPDWINPEKEEVLEWLIP